MPTFRSIERHTSIARLRTTSIAARIAGGVMDGELECGAQRK
jgi:hypothetical protein